MATARTASRTPAWGNEVGRSNLTTHWDRLLDLAEKVVSDTIGSMPLDLREHAQAVMVSYESVPPAELVDEGWDPDLLGLFEGESYGGADGEGDVLPRRIRLFLENLWDFAEGELEVYREEVRITYLHEFGHYLGLDEDGLAERGLE